MDLSAKLDFSFFYQIEKLYKNVKVEYDTCDCIHCSEGYSCHKPFPADLKIEGYNIECDLRFEEIYLKHKSKTINISFSENTIISDLIKGFDFLGINLICA